MLPYCPGSLTAGSIRFKKWMVSERHMQRGRSPHSTNQRSCATRRGQILYLLTGEHWWCGLEIADCKSYRCLLNKRHGRTTEAACWSWPANDCNSCFVHLVFFSHLNSSDRSRSSLSAGSLSSCVTESISVPKNGRHVLGPSTFSVASGMPKRAHRSVSK